MTCVTALQTEQRGSTNRIAQDGENQQCNEEEEEEEDRALQTLETTTATHKGNCDKPN